LIIAKRHGATAGRNHVTEGRGLRDPRHFVNQLNRFRSRKAAQQNDTFFQYSLGGQQQIAVES
jgi:hypothetical protein